MVLIACLVWGSGAAYIAWGTAQGYPAEVGVETVVNGSIAATIVLLWPVVLVGFGARAAYRRLSEK